MDTTHDNSVLRQGKGGVGGVVESSDGGMPNLVKLLSRRIVEW